MHCENMKLMKICSVGAEMLHADGQEDMKKLTFASRSFSNAPINKLQRENIFLHINLVYNQQSY